MYISSRVSYAAGPKEKTSNLAMLAGRRIQVWGFPSRGQVPDRMVPLTRDGGAREKEHVLPSRGGLSARDLRVDSPKRTYSTRDFSFILTQLPKPPVPQWQTSVWREHMRVASLIPWFPQASHSAWCHLCRPFLTLPAVRGYVLRVHDTYADATTRTRLCPLCAYVTTLAMSSVQLIAAVFLFSEPS